MVLFNQIDEMIKKDCRQILSSEVIEELESETLTHLLQVDSIFSVPLEIEVFRALSRWTNAQCNKSGIKRVGKNLQKLAGDLIYPTSDLPPILYLEAIPIFSTFSNIFKHSLINYIVPDSWKKKKSLIYQKFLHRTQII